jgi:nucleotide-binding universal stress UspA family protein
MSPTPSGSPVIAGVDGSPSSLAGAAHAARAAVDRGVELELVHGYLHALGYGAMPIDPYAITVPAPPADGERMLARLAERLRTEYPGLRVRARQVAGGPAATLVDESRRADLLVVGCRGLGGFAGLVLGSVSAQVAAHAHCPVLIVRPAGPDHPPDGPVLVGVDFSPGSDTALACAADEAVRRRVPLVVTHVWWNDPLETAMHPADDVVTQARSAAAGLLAGAVDEVRQRHPGLPVSRRLVHSLNPEHNLVAASRETILVVVGSRGRGGFGGLLLGSVSQALVHHAHCPVLVVHPHSHRR